ncbi:MAG: hypothetical protein WBL21_05860 [Salinimicrobium sp.]
MAQEKVLSGVLKEAYTGFDATIGIQNTEIFTGLEYIEEHRMINEKDKFFGENRFRPGTVFYNGEPYFNIPIKYNIFNDVLLVQLPNQRGKSEFKLLPNRLQGFGLDSHYFVNVWDKDNDFSGIYELIFRSHHIKVLKKYRLNMNKVSGRQLVHYEFEPERPKYYFSIDGNYFKLNRENLLRSFPDNRSFIRKSYHKFKKREREQKDEVLAMMFENLFKLSNENIE